MDPPHPLMEGHVETGKAILHLTALFSFYRLPISMREYNVIMLGQEWLQKLITKVLLAFYLLFFNVCIQECNCHWCLQPLFKKNLQALAQENEITQKPACL
ncbi:hypothetical protein NC651_030591 [Populus alba x Populus x berolinensis]|nr:hypothetical protein NC651_030591 [Populus alba x Populus x berolinensis]